MDKGEGRDYSIVHYVQSIGCSSSVRSVSLTDKKVPTGKQFPGEDAFVVLGGQLGHARVLGHPASAFDSIEDTVIKFNYYAQDNTQRDMVQVTHFLSVAMKL